eukprot:c17232_g1_i1 orf=361-1563(-)
MGKNKQKPARHGRRAYYQDEGQEDSLPSSAFDVTSSMPAEAPSSAEQEEEEEENVGSCYHIWEGPSKYELYQISVQSPKGDISYLQKFFLTYIGGRSPVHLREDFCGTALICAEWLKGGIQRLATGLDLDLEALTWGLQNNFGRLGGSACGRVHLLHGNVLQPVSLAQLVSSSTGARINDGGAICAAAVHFDKGYEEGFAKDNDVAHVDPDSEKARDVNGGDTKNPWPSVDIVCAFNYSCCCLHKRSDLVLYFKHALDALSGKGGIFAMDLYGGVSSEAPLKLRRHFLNFMYIWEQEAFDVINRMTKISLHFQLKNSKMLRHAFTYHWRLWSLPEVRDCLEEVGFDSIHIWLRDMPSLEEKGNNEDTWDNDSKYEETTAFYQQSAWNAYVVAVASPKIQR